MNRQPNTKNLSLWERIDLFIRKDGALSMLRLGTGVGIGAALSAGSLGVTALIAAGTVGLSATAEFALETYRKKRLLDIYSEEISTLSGKPVSELTPEDLEQAALPKEQGGHGIIALQKALETHRFVRNCYIGFHAVAAASVTLGAAAVSFAFQLLPAAALAGVVGALYEGVYQTVKGLGNLTLQVDERYTVTKRVREIADQISLGGTVSSTRVLGVFVEANEAMNAEIREKHGPYENLPIATKRALVKHYNKTLPIYALTQDINQGIINPTELGFLVYGQQSGVPRRVDAPMIHAVNNDGNGTARKQSLQTPENQPHSFVPEISQLAVDRHAQLGHGSALPGLHA